MSGGYINTTLHLYRRKPTNKNVKASTSKQRVDMAGVGKADVNRSGFILTTRQKTDTSTLRSSGHKASTSDYKASTSVRMPYEAICFKQIKYKTNKRHR